MGLALEVGILSDLITEDTEGFDYFKNQFANIDNSLKSNNIESTYIEPENLDKELIWSCQMYGYNGLHYLRRLAAHIWDGQLNIEPGNSQSSDDPILSKCLRNSFKKELRIEKILSMFGYSKEKNKQNFNHLILHSDAEGFYIPVKFDAVILDDNIAGGMLGSSLKLKTELEELAIWLELDLSIDPESEEVFEATEQEEMGTVKWKNFGIESHTCLNLYKACEESIKYNSAITFC